MYHYVHACVMRSMQACTVSFYSFVTICMPVLCVACRHVCFCHLCFCHYVHACVMRSMQACTVSMFLSVQCVSVLCSLCMGKSSAEALAFAQYETCLLSGYSSYTSSWCPMVTVNCCWLAKVAGWVYRGEIRT